MTFAVRGELCRSEESDHYSSTTQEERVAQLLRVQNFGVSRDGFGAGENQSFERPFGHADPGRGRYGGKRGLRVR